MCHFGNPFLEFVTGFRLCLYKSNINQLSGLPSLPLVMCVLVEPDATFHSCQLANWFLLKGKVFYIRDPTWEMW